MRHVNKTIAGFAVLSLVLAACGDDDDDDAATATTAAAATTAAPATDRGRCHHGSARNRGTRHDRRPGGTEAPGTTAAAGGGDLDALYQECLDNGATVNLIALPDEWANYKGILAELPRQVPRRREPGRRTRRLVGRRSWTRS